MSGAGQGCGTRVWSRMRGERVGPNSEREARDSERWGASSGEGGLAVAGYAAQLPIRVFLSLGQEVAVLILRMQGLRHPFCCPQPGCFTAATAAAAMLLPSSGSENGAGCLCLCAMLVLGLPGPAPRSTQGVPTACHSNTRPPLHTHVKAQLDATPHMIARRSGEAHGHAKRDR